MDKKLKELEKQYKDVPIPKELDNIVENALKQGQRKKKRTPQWILGTAAAAMLFTASLNISPAMARTLADIPVVGNVVKVLTWTEYEVAEETYDANIKVPSIENLENKDLANTLNEQYRAEGKALYEQFIAEVDDLKANGGGHIGVDSGYDIKTDNDQILSISRYVVNTVASSSTVIQYDTIDKKNEILLSLPMLFKNDAYINVISENIKEQMRAEMKATNQEKTYWVKGVGTTDDSDQFDSFTAIDAQHEFYITDSGKLMISFDKYEVAPGYMGVVEFEIPTNILQNILVSNEYIQ
ncbi:MAG: RsiV family protein [Lysinibacillus sp.]